MSDGAYRRRVSEIERELTALVSKINELNAKRQQLSGQRALLERLLKKLNDFMGKDGTDLELTLLHLHLSNHLDTLKGKIGATRPDDARKRKHELTQERALLDAGRKVAITLMGRVAKNQESGHGCTR
jgi:chromosome segregation ATPase